jgi:hypothetical protein
MTTEAAAQTLTISMHVPKAPLRKLLTQDRIRTEWILHLGWVRGLGRSKQIGTVEDFVTKLPNEVKMCVVQFEDTRGAVRHHSNEAANTSPKLFDFGGRIGLHVCTAILMGSGEHNISARKTLAVEHVDYLLLPPVVDG